MGLLTIYKNLQGHLSLSEKSTGLKISGEDIRLKRRLETFAVGFWTFTGLIAPWFVYPLMFLAVTIPLLLSFFKLSFLIALIQGSYLIWMWIIDRKVIYSSSRRSDYFRKLPVWRWYNNFFPITLVKTPECIMDPKKNYLFCAHPHGLLCFGVCGAFGTDGNPRLKELFGGFQMSVLTFNQTFMFPGSRDFALGAGFCSAERKTMDHLLSRKEGGNIAVLMPGGAPEALDYCPGKYILQLKKRKGFIKVAMQNGAPLVPVFVFGENVIWNQVRFEEGTFLRKLQDFVQKVTNIPPVVWYGRGLSHNTFGFLPKRKPLNVVVGAPIPVEKVDTPTQAQIDELHENYVKALTSLFYDNREKYSEDPTETLIIK